LGRSFHHVLAATKEESQTEPVLAMSQVPQAGSHPPKTLPDLPSGLEEITNRDQESGVRWQHDRRFLIPDS
jgi:hypothetical protein